MTLGAAFTRFRTLRRGAQQALAPSCDDVAAAMGCLVLRCGQSGSVTSISSNCESSFGVHPCELMGGGFLERVQVADRPAFLKAISDACAGSLTAAAALRWCSTPKPGQGGNAAPVFHWLEMRARREGQGHHFNREPGQGPVIAVFRDVTEVKRRDFELEEARAKFEETKAARELFLAHAGHEIRAPLNAIAGFSELLAGPGLFPPEPGKQREFAAIIYQSAQHLLAVVNSLTDMSLIQSGALQTKPERFAVAPQIDLCCSMVRLQARKRGVELIHAHGAGVDTVIADKRLFTQIFINLLTNAVKFTPAKGRVTISARAEANFLLFEVIDTGIGISACDLNRLGDPFFRASSSNGRQEKGAGLGLSIVRDIVGFAGGRITVASELERGTCVRVRLPLDYQGAASAARGPAKIETVAGLPFLEKPGTNPQAKVKKIA